MFKYDCINNVIELPGFGREKQKYNFVVSCKTFLTSGEIKLLMLEYTFTYSKGIFLSADINAWNMELLCIKITVLVAIFNASLEASLTIQMF